MVSTLSVKQAKALVSMLYKNIGLSDKRYQTLLAIYGESFGTVHDREPEKNWVYGEVSWFYQIRMGLNPMRMYTNHGITGNAYKISKYGSEEVEFTPHPIHYAAMFGHFLGLEKEARAMYDAHSLLSEAMQNKNEKLDKMFSYGYDEWQYPPDVDPAPPIWPKDIGLPVYESIDNLDRLTFIHWYSRKALKDKSDHGQNLRHVKRALTIEKHLHLEEIYTSNLIETCLGRAEEIKTPILTDALFLYGTKPYSSNIGSRFRSLSEKMGGVYLSILAVHKYASQDEMIRGLRAAAAASENTAKVVAGHLRRAPTEEELLKLRGVGLINILYGMPQIHMDVVSKYPNLQGHLLSFLGRERNKNKLMECLSPHKHRPAGLIGELTLQTEVTNPSRWLTAFKKESDYFLFGEKLRASLIAASAHEAAFLYAMAFSCKEEKTDVRDKMLDLAETCPEAQYAKELLSTEEAKEWLKACHC